MVVFFLGGGGQSRFMSIISTRTASRIGLYFYFARPCTTPLQTFIFILYPIITYIVLYPKFNVGIFIFNIIYVFCWTEYAFSPLYCLLLPYIKQWQIQSISTEKKSDMWTPPETPTHIICLWLNRVTNWFYWWSRRLYMRIYKSYLKW